MLTTFRKYLLFLTTFLICLSAYSQSSQEPFGKNRVQYKNFEWKFITTSNFEVYYYGHSTDLAIKVATFAEDDYSRIIELAGYTPSDKVKIILYNSVSDRQQSNIGLADQEIMIGGQTVLVKAKIEIAFKGTQLQLMKDISYGISSTIINTVMYGGGVKDVVKSSYLMNLPDWFISGASAYIAEDWGQEMDNTMRDKVLFHKIKNPTSYTGEEAKIIGQSIWNYIGKEYGDNNIPSIIGLTRAFRNERESIESNLGISFNEFLDNWKAYYKNMNLPIADFYKSMPDSTKLLNEKKGTKFYALSMNKEGTYLSYVQNYKGKYKLKLININSGQKKTLTKGGYKRVEQPADFMLPLTAWQSEMVISTVIRKRDKLYLKNFDLKSHKKTKRYFDDYRQIYGIAYSKDGNQLVMSADKTGQTDIFSYNLPANSIVQITNDAYDDIEPIVANDNTIIFSSNRKNDTINKNKDLPLYTDNYNLFQYSPTTKTILKKLTFENNNHSPKVSEDNTLYFLSDKKGILNISKLTTFDNSSVQITNQPKDITSYTFSTKASSMSFVSLHKGKETIYLTKSLWDKTSFITPETERKNLILSFKNTEGSNTTIDSVNFNFNSNEETDFDKLIFESETKKDTSTPKKEIPSILPIYSGLRYSGPLKYQNPFSADKVVSTLMVDPIRGLGALLEGGMSDLLGNHRIDAGGFIAFDFRSSKLFCEYRYVKKRIDFKVLYNRSTLNPENNFAAHRYALNTFGFTASYPFSVYHRFSVSPFITGTAFREIFANVAGFKYLAKKDITSSYEAIRAEYVYDNTLVTGINMLKGTRFKASAEYYTSNQNKSKDFGLLFLDFRKYIPIHKEIVFATRISYGQYFGNAPKNFLIGGMDNWLLSNRDFYSNANAATQNPLTIDPGVNNSDILFVRYVTSLRGFKYNSQFGPKYLLFNGELRIPVVQYFYNGTIGSNFLRNLQLVGFTDIGTAYKGKLTAQNTENIKTVTVDPFTATVKSYLNPFLVGFGGGFRTMFLGYYIKADLGWGIQNGIISKPQLYLTFGYDF